MSGTSVGGTLLIGIFLIIGHRYFPNESMMWLANPHDAMDMWRIGVVGCAVVAAIVSEYFRSVYLQLLWVTVAVVLGWSGYWYVLDQTTYILDALLMFSAAVTFAGCAIQPNDRPVDVTHLAIRLDWLWSRIASHGRYSSDQLVLWHNSTDANTLHNRLVVKGFADHSLQP